MIDYRIYGLYRYFQWRLKCNPKNWHSKKMIEKYGTLIALQRLVNDLSRHQRQLEQRKANAVKS